MQMDKSNCDGTPDTTKLSGQGIRFEPTRAVQNQHELTEAAISTKAALLAEALAEVEKSSKK